jgi:hypothetical protein
MWLDARVYTRAIPWRHSNGRWRCSKDAWVQWACCRQLNSLLWRHCDTWTRHPFASKTARKVTILCHIPFNTECLALPLRPLYPSMNWIGRWVRLLRTSCLCRESRADFSVLSRQRGQEDWTGAGYVRAGNVWNWGRPWPGCWPWSVVVTCTFRLLMVWYCMRLTRATSLRTLDPIHVPSKELHEADSCSAVVDSGWPIDSSHGYSVGRLKCFRNFPASPVTDIGIAR